MRRCGRCDGLECTRWFGHDSSMNESPNWRDGLAHVD